MPTYDYVCDNCGHKFELFQSIKESAKKKCPECGKSKLRRLFGTGAAIVFKGSGFYQTDYRSDAYKKPPRPTSPRANRKARKASLRTPKAPPVGRKRNPKAIERRLSNTWWLHV